jgi:hypothetical protein
MARNVVIGVDPTGSSPVLTWQQEIVVTVREKCRRNIYSRLSGYPVT